MGARNIQRVVGLLLPLSRSDLFVWNELIQIYPTSRWRGLVFLALQ